MTLPPHRTALATAVFLLAACTSAPDYVPTEPLPKPVEIPVRIEQDMPFVQADLDGTPLSLLVDLGSREVLSLYDGRLDRTGVQPTGRAHMSTNAFGESVQAREFVAPTFRLGSLVLRDVPGSEGIAPAVVTSTGSRPEPPGDGHIGLGLLEHYRVVLDMPGKRLVLYSKKEPLPPELFDWPKGGLLVKREGLFVHGSAEGKPLRYLLDSGASTSVMRPNSAAKIGLTPKDPNIPKIDVPALGVEGFGVLPLVFYVIPYQHPDVDALLGANFFQKMPILLDFEAKHIGYGPRSN